MMNETRVNDTIRRFGYPDTLIAPYRHWVVLLRPDQPTLGSLVVAAIGAERALADLPAEAFAELRTVVGHVEGVLREAVGYGQINYLMLMMVDPHVHWHVIPRYEGERNAVGIAISDLGWPKAPQLGGALALDDDQIAALGDWLRSKWPATI
jgi:diadenosine tetraphosphate (Ap4A) HIT family hydrolase